MQLFDEVQKVVFSKGGKIKVSIPPSFSILLTNKTQDVIFLYPNQSSRIGYPLFKGDTLELENVHVSSEFFTVIKDTDTTDEKGLFIICRPWIETRKSEENNVIINNQKT
jgi:hypothetical protein